MIIEIKDKGDNSCPYKKDITINGVVADMDDFGIIELRDTFDDEERIIENFVQTPPVSVVLDKYGITTSEFNEAFEKIASTIPYGLCRGCKNL